MIVHKTGMESNPTEITSKPTIEQLKEEFEFLEGVKVTKYAGDYRLYEQDDIITGTMIEMINRIGGRIISVSADHKGRNSALFYIKEYRSRFS